MRTGPVREVTVCLDDVQDLFTDPDPGSDRHVSGIEELYRVVKVHTRVLMQRPTTYRVTIELPPDKITDGLGETMGARIRRFCQFQTEQSYQELLTLRRQGVDSLWMGLFVLLPCLVLGVLCTWLSQAGIRDILQALFTVLAALFMLSAGWVALWFPVEYFLYDPWPYQQDMRVYRYMADAEVMLRARRDDAAAGGPAATERSDSVAGQA